MQLQIVGIKKYFKLKRFIDPKLMKYNANVVKTMY